MDRFVVFVGGYSHSGYRHSLSSFGKNYFPGNLLEIATLRFRFSLSFELHFDLVRLTGDSVIITYTIVIDEWNLIN